MNEAEIMAVEPKVRYHADRMGRRTPAHIDTDELYSAGLLGLMDAAAKFKPERGTKFSTFADHRISGAILDHLRSLDWVPRGTRAAGRKLEAAEQVAAESGETVAESLGMELDEFYEFEASAQAATVASLDSFWSEDAEGGPCDVIANPSSPNPEKVFGDAEAVEAALGRLSGRELEVIEAIYIRELSARNVAAEFGVTEGRVSQIRSSALKKMRGAL